MFIAPRLRTTSLAQSFLFKTLRWRTLRDAYQIQQRATFRSASSNDLFFTNLLNVKSDSTAEATPRKKQKQKAMPPRPLWLIKEDELEEKFIKGGGPGGQKINKSNIKVQITHKPTGIVVNSQDSRSQEKNRAKAREILALRLEQMQNPETCRLGVLAEKKRVAKRNRAKKAAKKHKNKVDKEDTGELSNDIDLDSDPPRISAEEFMKQIS